MLLKSKYLYTMVTNIILEMQMDVKKIDWINIIGVILTAISLLLQLKSEFKKREK